MSKHTLSVLVENKPGVLARIAALFSRRGFNIDSLAVGETEYPDVSRMTVVVDVEDTGNHPAPDKVAEALTDAVRLLASAGVEVGTDTATERRAALAERDARIDHLVTTTSPPARRPLARRALSRARRYAAGMRARIAA